MPSRVIFNGNLIDSGLVCRYSLTMNSERFLEKIGQKVGETAGTGLLDFLRSRAAEMKPHLHGLEHLTQLKETPFILVANHLIPVSPLIQKLQMPPDAFVLENIVEDLLNVETTMMSKSDDGWWAENPTQRLIQKRIVNPVGRGVVRGMGLIPVAKNPGVLNRDLTNDVGQALEAGQVIIAFPEGHWYEDFDSKHRLDTGPANLSRRFKVPMLPTYIKGARTWNTDQEISVHFGKPIYPADFSKKEITELIRASLTELQQADRQSPASD